MGRRSTVSGTEIPFPRKTPNFPEFPDFFKRSGLNKYVFKGRGTNHKDADNRMRHSLARSKAAQNRYLTYLFHMGKELQRCYRVLQESRELALGDLKELCKFYGHPMFEARKSRGKADTINDETFLLWSLVLDEYLQRLRAHILEVAASAHLSELPGYEDVRPASSKTPTEE